MPNNIVAIRPKHNFNKAYFIQEESVFKNAELIKRYKSGKVKFSAVLQTAGDTNQNKRVYPKDVLVDGISRIRDAIKKRNLVGELDHPIASGDRTSQIRQTTVLYEHVSHIITELFWEGNKLIGVMETTPYTPKGKILSGLILDNVSVGFSLRGLADLEDNGTHQIVLAPLVIITWDCVCNPSHKHAVIREVYQEQLRVINESRSIVRCKNGICYLSSHSEPSVLKEEIVDKHLINIYKKYCK